MNFYKHHIGDYDADTAHLSWLEDAAYRRLISLYYRREEPLPEDTAQVCRLVRAQSPAERKAVETVLKEFFMIGPDGWRNKRCDEEVAAAQAKAEANRNNGRGGGRPRRDGNPQGTLKQEPINNPLGFESDPTQNLSQTPVTSNQTPDVNTHTTTMGGRVCVLMRRAGIPEANPGHPTLLALIDAGCTEVEFTGAAAEAVKRGKGFAYAIGMLRKQREDAAKATLHTGPMPEVMTPGQAAAHARIAAVSPSLLARKPAPVTTQTAEVIDVATRRLG